MRKEMKPLTPEQKEHIRILREEALEERRAEAREHLEELRKELRESGTHVVKTEKGFVLTKKK